MNTIRYSLILLLCNAGAAFSAHFSWLGHSRLLPDLSTDFLPAASWLHSQQHHNTYDTSNLPKLDAETIAANARHTTPSARYKKQHNREWSHQVEAVIRHAETGDATALQQYCNAQNVSKDQLFHALHKAAGKGNCRALESLLAVGADINGMEDSGLHKTPLMWACNCGQVETVGLLLAHGAWVNVKSPDNESAFLVAASSAIGSITNHIQILELLKKHKADPSVRDSLGMFPLINALSGPGDSIAIAQWLIDNNVADVEVEDSWVCPRTGVGLFNNPYVNMTPAKIALLARNGARMNSDAGYSDLLARVAAEFTRHQAEQRSDSTLWARRHSAKQLAKGQGNLQVLAQRGARLSPEARQSACKEALAVIDEAHEQRCEAMDAVLIEGYDIPQVLIDLVCQFSDDVALQESVMRRHNTTHTECAQQGIYTVFADMIRQLFSDELRPWKRRLLKPVR